MFVVKHLILATSSASKSEARVILSTADSMLSDFSTSSATSSDSFSVFPVVLLP